MKIMLPNMKKIFFVIFGLFILAYLSTWFTNTTYLWKAIIYQQVDYDDYKIFENRIIEAPSSSAEWPEAKKAIPINQTLDNYLSELESIGFLAIKDDSIICEKYWPEYNVNTKANSFSVAKSYVSMLIGFALQDGYIKSINDPVSNYLPEFTQNEEIRIKDLLTMSSGINWIERYDMPINHTTESYYGTDLKALVLGLDIINPPGTEWHYKGCDPQILAMIIEKTTGSTVSEYLSNKFWKPVGSTANGLWSLDKKDGIEKAYCCINTNARNFARIGKLYLNYGNWNNTQLLDSSYVYESLQPNLIPNKSGEPTKHYGYQWWMMDDLGKNIKYARGLNGQYVIIIPDKNMILVRLGNKRDIGKGKHPIEVLRMVEWAENI